MSALNDLIGPMRARREAFLKDTALTKSYIAALESDANFELVLKALPQLPDLLFNYAQIMMDRVSAIEADLDDLGFDVHRNRFLEGRSIA